MPENKYTRLLLRILSALLWAAILWLLLTVALPWLLPFLAALGLAALLEPVVKRLPLPRWSAAALCTVALALVLAGGMGLLAWRLGVEVAALLGRLPVLFGGLSALGRQLEEWGYRLLIAAPPALRIFLTDALENVVAQGISLPGRLYDWLGGAVAWAASALPEAGLFLFTTLLATYFTSAGRPGLLAFLNRQIPERFRPAVSEVQSQLKGTLGSWLRAQGLLMLVTFGVLTAGFLLLRVDLAILLAAVTALLDALPIFGTGIVLIPWAVGALLGGKLQLALGLVALYGLAFLVRSLLEPKLLGQRMGLPPLAALCAMYVGFHAFGVAGMIFAPLVATFLKQLHDCGMIKLWRD